MFAATDCRKTLFCTMQSRVLFEKAINLQNILKYAKDLRLFCVHFCWKVTLRVAI